MRLHRALADTVAVVTGASSGIGREIALQLAASGVTVSLAARRRDRLEEVAEGCRARGSACLAVPTDVTDPDQCRRLVTATIQEYGRLDTLINNAGVSMAFRFDELQDLSLPERIIRVNYLGSLYCTHYALPHLKASRGRLVGVASLTGKTGVPLRSVYAASKHAMAGFFDSLRIELRGSGVTVTMVYPDFVQTEVRERALGADGRPIGIHPRPAHRFMTAADCADAVLRAAAARRREVLLGVRGKLGWILKLAVPRVVDRIAERAMREVRLSDRDSAVT